MSCIQLERRPTILIKHSPWFVEELVSGTYDITVVSIHGRVFSFALECGFFGRFF